MGKSVKIPGRLESAETGNIVAGADAIQDDVRGKTQYVVNNELEAAILQLGESKQNKLTFDQTPTEDSPNPVTSGGVYAADQVLSQAIEAILLLIPSAASALNKLVDMATMNSSIATATASFKGTYNLVSDLHLGVDATHAQIAAALDALSLDADNNDYAFVQVPNTDTAPTEIAKTERYKFNGTNWAYEYDLNNSGFTSAQWNAINSGITVLLVSKLSALPTNEALVAALAGKQDNLTFDNVPTAGSPNPVKSGGIYTRNNEIVALINALDAAKQDVLTFDTTPTSGSPNPVTSNGIYLAIQLVQTAVVALDGRMSTAETKISTAETNIVNLQAAYSALTQSDIVVVDGALPSSGQQQNVIYRQPDPDHTPPQFYSDYMWNGTAWVLMAQYDNAIDDVPTYGSHNLVESGGVEETSSFADFILTPVNTSTLSFVSNANGSVDVSFLRSSYICITCNGKRNFNINRPSNTVNVPSAYALIYDFTDSTVKVVALNHVSLEKPPVLLAMVNNGIVEKGAFLPAWNMQQAERTEGSLSIDIGNNPFGDYAIYPSYKSAVYGEIVPADESVNMVFTRNTYIVCTSKGNVGQFNIPVTFDEGETSKTYNVPASHALVFDRDDSTPQLKVVALNNVSYTKDCLILVSNSGNFQFNGYFSGNIEIYKPLARKQVLFIGDSITEYGSGSNGQMSNHWLDEFQKLTGCFIYNRGGSGTTLANYKDGDTSPEYSFCGANSYCGRMQKPDDNTIGFVNNGGFPDASHVDLVILFASANDWCRRTTHEGSFGTLEGAIDQTTYCGAVRYLLRKLKHKYGPKCPIVVLSNMHIFSADVQGQGHWNEIIYDGNSEGGAYTIQQSQTVGSIGKSLYDYIDVLEKNARLYGCHYLNMQDVGFTAVIAQDRNAFYFDGLHPNERGGKLMAQYLLGYIRANNINV